jgi:hypothetical protein
VKRTNIDIDIWWWELFLENGDEYNLPQTGAMLNWFANTLGAL